MELKVRYKAEANITMAVTYKQTSCDLQVRET